MATQRSKPNEIAQVVRGVVKKWVVASAMETNFRVWVVGILLVGMATLALLEKYPCKPSLVSTCRKRNKARNTIIWLIGFVASAQCMILACADVSALVYSLSCQLHRLTQTLLPPILQLSVELDRSDLFSLDKGLK